MPELKFTHSNNIDSLKRQCSLVTIQSDPRGQFSTLIDHMRNLTGNYVNVLFQISEMKVSDASALIKFASRVEGMVIFVPKPFFKTKNNSEAAAAKEKGNLNFKKGNLRQAFREYSVAVVKAKYPENEVLFSATAFRLQLLSLLLFPWGHVGDALGTIWGRVGRL